MTPSLSETAVRKRVRPSAKPRLASVIEHASIGTLAPYPGNPRKHSQRQVTKLAGAMRIVGFQVPILVDGQNNIIAGHGRYLAAKELALSEVPVIRIHHLTPEQIKAYRIADNRLSELSSWDEEALAVELKQLVVSLDEQVIELTSFEIGEIDARLEILDDKPVQDPADDIIELADGLPVSKLGDVWMLGNHRLLCGSSLEEQ